MLILSTKLIVNESLTNEIFTEMIIEWLSDNHNYGFGTIEYNGELPWKVDCQKDHLEMMEYDKALTVRLVSNSSGVIWTNDYVLTEVGGKRVVSVQLYSDTENMSVKMPERFNKPRIINQIIANGYGGIDGDIPVSDTPYEVSDENLDCIRNLIMKKSEYFMPVIYVTYPRYAIDQPVDYTEMAKNMSGVAHVVVEPKEMAAKVRKETDGHNPYAGAVEIFYGKHNSYRLLPDNYQSMGDMRSFIESMVFQKVLMTRIDDELSWMRIHFKYLQEKGNTDPELLQVYEQLLKESESDDVIKKQRIEELEYQIIELEDQLKDLRAVIKQKDGQIENYQYGFKQVGEYSSVNKICLDSTEQDLYEGERRDVILKVLDKERNQMDSSQKLRASRKYHVLSSVVQSNQQSDTDERLAKNLQDLIDKSGSLNAQRKRQLLQAGFNIEEGSHYKITFQGDERYMFTLSKSPSDHRTNINTLKDAVKVLFGC